MNKLTKAALELLHLINKAEADKTIDLQKEFFHTTKDAASAIERLRFAAGLSEKAVAEALGTSPEDYLKFRESGSGLEITAAGIKSLAKLLKMSVEDFAAEIVSDNPNDPAASGPGAQPNADPAAPPEKSDKNKDPKSDPLLKSSQIRVIEGAQKTAAIAKGDSKEEKVKMVKMALAGLRTSLDDVQKAVIAPGDFSPGGVFQPEQSSNIVDLIVDQSAFLSKINILKMNTKKYDMPMYDISGRIGKRLATGWAPDDSNRTAGTSSFMRFDANKYDVEFLIDNETIQLNQDKQNLENFVYDKFMKAIKNDLVDLVINGTADSATAEELVWTNLAKGYLSLADTNCAASHKVALTALTVQASFAALVDAQVNNDSRYYSQDQVFLCGHKDWRTYITELNARTDGLTTIVGSPEALRQYDGQKIEPTDSIATKNVLFTKYDNLWLGIVSGPNEGIYVQRLEVPGGILFRISLHLDPNIGNYKALTVGKP